MTDYINELKSTKNDIKSAIEEKGVAVNGGMITFADAINKIGIKAGGYILPNGMRLAFSTSSENLTKYDFSQCESFENMFYASSFTSFPSIDFSNVNNVRQCFYACNTLKSMPIINFSNVNNASYCFEKCYYLTTIGGFIDFGKQEDLMCYDMFLDCDEITRASCINIFNNLYDRAAAGYEIITLKFHSNVLARLSDNDIAIATNKGWIIS